MTLIMHIRNTSLSLHRGSPHPPHPFSRNLSASLCLPLSQNLTPPRRKRKGVEVGEKKAEQKREREIRDIKEGRENVCVCMCVGCVVEGEEGGGGYCQCAGCSSIIQMYWFVCVFSMTHFHLYVSYGSFVRMKFTF